MEKVLSIHGYQLRHLCGIRNDLHAPGISEDNKYLGGLSSSLNSNFRGNAVLQPLQDMINRNLLPAFRLVSVVKH